MIKKLKEKTRFFLKKSEKYTQTDMIYLARGGFWFTVGQFISVLAGFLVSLAFANLLEPTVYGNYRYILSIAGILSIFALSGMGSAITQAAARNIEGPLQKGFVLKIKWGFLGSLAAVFIASYYFFKGNYVLPLPLLIVAALMPLMEAGIIFENFLQGKKLFKQQITYSSITKIIASLATIFTLLLTKNLFWLIAVYFLSNTLLNIIFYRLTVIKCKPNDKDDGKTISFGKQLSLMNILSATANLVDSPLMFHFMGASDLAVYYFSVVIPDQIKDLTKKVADLALPKLAIQTHQEIQKHLIAKIVKFTFVCAAIATAYIITAPFLYRWFFPKYITSIAFSQWYALSFLVIPASVLITAFQAKMMKKELYQLKVIIPLMRITLLAVFIPLLGIWGAIAAQIIIAFATLFFMIFFFKNKWNN